MEIKETRSQWGAPGRIRALYYTEYRRSSLGRIAMTFPFKKATMPWASIKPQTGKGLANMYTGTVRLYEQHSTSKMLSRTRYIFHACTETCRWPLTPHPWNDHSIPYCQRGVSCSDPTLSYMLSHKSTKNKLLDHCNQPVQKEIQGTPRFPNICRNVGSLAVMASVPRGKTNRWSLDDLKTDLKPWWFWCFPKDIQGLGPLPLCLHSLSIHVSFYIHVSELTVQVDFYRFLLGFGSRSKKEQDPFYFFPANQGLYLSDGYCNLKKWQINILKSGLCWPSCRSFANKSCRIQTDLRISTDFADKAPGLGKAVDIWR